MSEAYPLLIVFGAFAYLALGSFICVLIDRMPVQLDSPNEYGDLWDTRPWREVLGGHSRCSSCATPVRPVDNIPIVSWLVLRGRCRGCGERIPAFHPIVEVLTPTLFLTSVWTLGADWRLVLVLWLIPIAVAVSVIDIMTFIVPTKLVWPAFAGSVLLAVVVAGTQGQWKWLLGGVLGIVVFAGLLFTIWFVSPNAMGFGDVRLATLLGFNIGFFGGVRPWGVVVLSVLALGLAAILGLILGFAAMGLRGRKARVPFGPSLCLSAFVCVVWAHQIIGAYGLYQLAG